MRAIGLGLGCAALGLGLGLGPGLGSGLPVCFGPRHAALDSCAPRHYLVRVRLTVRVRLRLGYG